MTQRDVLFVHGWWADSWVWSQMADRFEDAGFKTHTLTLPGPESDRSSFADNLQYALDMAQSIGDPILVGHSAGGLLALKMCETLSPPACVAITPAPPAGVLPRPSALLIQFFFAALPSIILGREFFPRKLLRRIVLNRLQVEKQDEVLDRMRPVSAPQVRMIVPSLIGIDCSRIDAPLLVVGAAEDRLTPPGQTKAIARRYRADYWEYQDAAHYVLVEPICSRMASDVIAWLKEAVSKGDSG